MAVLRFWAPLGGSEATHDDHFRLIEKHVGDLLITISVNWTFLRRLYSRGATSNYPFRFGDFAPTGAGWPKIAEEWVAPTNRSFLRKLGQIFFRTV